jgi:hypothetical protein
MLPARRGDPVIVNRARRQPPGKSRLRSAKASAFFSGSRVRWPMADRVRRPSLCGIMAIAKSRPHKSRDPLGPVAIDLDRVM